MLTRLRSIIPPLLAVLFVASCESGQVVTSAPSETPPAASASTPQVNHTAVVRSADAGTAVTRFGLDLYAVLRERQDGNLVISPLSIATALGMLLAGTDGQATDELLAALHFDEVDQASAGLAALSAALHARGQTEGITLTIANRSFVQQGYIVRAEFLETLARHFGDVMESLPFTTDPDGARSRINHWVAEQTNDLIDELLKPGTVDSLTRLMLVNAVYLLADWDVRFDERNTADEPFHLIDGTVVDVPMMRDTRSVPIAVGDDYRAVELAYVGEELAMLIIVPEDLEAFEQDLNITRIAGITDQLVRRETALWLPKVETRSNATLNDPLAAIGVNGIFEPGGGSLRGIADDPSLHVSSVIHETYLRMDEQGTEAAAATAIGVRTTSLPPPPLEVRVDRPYFLVLRDRPSGAVLFIGRIIDPR